MDSDIVLDKKKIVDYLSEDNIDEAILCFKN